MTASPAANSPSRGRIIGARTLLVLGVLLTVVSILSTYVKREALDEGQFKQTSQELIASPAIQEQVAAQLVDALNANVDVSGELDEQAAGEPPGRSPAPIAGISRELVDRARRSSHAAARPGGVRRRSPRVSQQQFVKVLHGDTRALETSNGNVVLDLRPLVLKLGDRFGFIENLADKVPQDSAQVTILKSDDLKTGPERDALARAGRELHLDPRARLLGRRDLARPRPPPPGGALARDRARRRRRARPPGPLGRGEVLRRQPRRRATRSGRQRATPGTSSRTSLAAAGWVALSVGILIAVGAWLVGPGARATSARASLAPVMERAGVAWGAFVVAMAADHLDPADPGVPDDR